MKKFKSLLFLALILSPFNLFATNYYVSTLGNDANTGTSISSPFLSVDYAISNIKNAGDSVIIRSGTYALSSHISISKYSGTKDKHIVITAYKPDIQNAYPNEGRPVLNFSSMGTGSSNQGIDINGISYYSIYGLIIKGAGDNGMLIQGSASYIYLEFCAFTRNMDAGLQIKGGANHCYITNCDSYENADYVYGSSSYTGGNADGFAAKLDVGDSIYYRGCRAWSNSDDGWDGYLRSTLGGVWTIIENCWAWHNGYYWGNDTTTAGMNGNGIKMGGSDAKNLAHNHRVINCFTAYNKAKGFDQNNNTGSMYLYNCTGYKNNLSGGAGYDFGLNNSVTYVAGAVTSVINCVCTNGSVNLKSGAISLSNNFSAADSDFSSLDTTGISGHRKIDGSLPNVSFLHLANKSSLIDAGSIVDTVQYYGANGIPYNGTKPDLGCFETIAPSLRLTSGSNQQTVNTKMAITNIVYTYGGSATGASLTSTLPIGMDTVTNTTTKTFTISGTPSIVGVYNYTVTSQQVSGTAVSLTGTITAVPPTAATLAVTKGSASQIAYVGTAIDTVVYTYGGGAFGAKLTGVLPSGVNAVIDTTTKTVTITGNPTAINSSSYTVQTINAYPNDTITGTITVYTPTTLSAPSGISASATSSSININWPAVANAASYTVSICTMPADSTDVTMYFNLNNTGTLNTGDLESVASSSNLATCYTPTSGSAYRNSSATQALTLVATDYVTQLVIGGASASALRTMTYYSINNGAAITSGITQATSATCGEYIIKNLYLRKGNVFNFYFNSSFRTNYIKATVDTFSCSETTINTTSYTLTGLAPNTKCIYKIRANSNSAAYTTGSYSTAQKITTSNIATEVKNQIEDELKLIQTENEITATGLDVTKMTIINVDGQKTASANGNTINISSLGKGFYVVIVTTTDGSVVSKKFVKY